MTPSSQTELTLLPAQTCRVPLRAGLMVAIDRNGPPTFGIIRRDLYRPRGLDLATGTVLRGRHIFDVRDDHGSDHRLQGRLAYANLRVVTNQVGSIWFRGSWRPRWQACVSGGEEFRICPEHLQEASQLAEQMRGVAAPECRGSR